MRTPHSICALSITSVVLLGACGSLDTGISSNQPKNRPTAQGVCPGAQSVCGVGAFARCVDLQTDPNHCGGCGHNCTPGIACLAGVCQQTSCASTTSPFSGTGDSGQADFFQSHWQIFADVNGDTHLDLIEWRNDPGRFMDAFRVSLGQPAGGFAVAETYHASVEVGDIRIGNDNDDGSDDLFVFGETTSGVGPAQLEVWLGHPDGHLTRLRDNDLTGADVSERPWLAVGDLSGDGWSDAVTRTAGDMRSITVFLSDSTGAVHPTQTYRTGRFGVTSIHIRDWNGDGSPDLVVFDGVGLEILYNRGDGTFEPPLGCPALLPTADGQDLLAEDFNQDGLVDLAFNGNPIRVVLRQSECGFSPISQYDVPVPKSIPQTMGGALAGGGVPIIRAADMNGDGQLDLVVTLDVVYNNAPLVEGEVVGNIAPVAVNGDTFLAVLLGKPDGTFQLQDTVVSLGSDSVTDLAIGEGTGDKRPDVAAASSDGQVHVWENTCQ